MTLPLCVWLVRHGETRWNREGRAQGHADLPLTARGRMEVRQLAARLRPVPFVGAWSSPARRAVTTARGILAARGRAAPRVRYSAQLRELAYGACRGRRPRDWPPAVVEAWTSSPWTARFPDGSFVPRAAEARTGGRGTAETGESLCAVAARARRVLARIAHQVPRGDVLVVTHGHLMRALHVPLLHLAPDAAAALAMPNAAVVRLGHDPSDGTWAHLGSVAPD